ncbi:MAG: L,D-transpeptidase [Pseudomonadota bacterium]|nr:L,D-transpeptidase [Pseudomonadota bacterium]
MGVIFLSGVKRKGNPENLLTMKLLRFFSLSLLLLSTVITAEPFWGAKASSPADTSPEALQPGEFVWESQAVPSGPVAIVVSLSEQRANVYRNGIRIGYTTVSTGKKGHRSPTGVFTILNKDRHHHSSTYNNAAMPYSERLTWGGIALHAGGLPGYPSSHGCIHLPSVFAADLFKITKKGMTVVIADETSAPRSVTHPGMLAPVDDAGEAVVEERLSGWEKFKWHPEKSPEGPVSILISGADKQALVFRNGVEIGLAKINIDTHEQPLGTHAYMAIHGKKASTITWKAVVLPRHATDKAIEPDLQAVERIKLPPRFVAAIKPLLTPGVTMMITDAPIHQHTTGSPLDVIIANHGDEG